MNRTITTHEENGKFHVEPSWNGHEATFKVFTKNSIDLLTEVEANQLVDALISAGLELEHMKGVRNGTFNPSNPFNNRIEF